MDLGGLRGAIPHHRYIPVRPEILIAPTQSMLILKLQREGRELKNAKPTKVKARIEKGLESKIFELIFVRALPNKYSHRMENRVETNTQRELSQMDSLLLTSGNLKTIEIASQHQSLSNSWPDPTFHPTKPPLHQNQTSHLDEIESSESEHEVQVRSRGELALSSVESSSDSEGGMIIPSKPSIHLRSHEEVNSNLHPKSSSDLDAPRNPERESEPELPDKSNINRESDIDQRISTLRKFINKTRFVYLRSI